MSSITSKMFSDPDWLVENKFEALAEVSRLLAEKENAGREALIRVLENAELLGDYRSVIESLVQRAGLFPYQRDPNNLSTNDLLNFEFHAVEGLDNIVLHSVQGQVYRALVDGANVILSAPTSFGKSLLIDAMIASRRFKNIVVIVPTIALIDETRRRLANRFSKEFKIITHPSQHTEEKNIYILTQERFVEFEKTPIPEFFVLDEFYKLSPNRGDDRTFVLNEAFYKLFKSGAPFFLIGPNIEDITIDEKVLKFRFFKTDFATVATEVQWIQGDRTKNTIEICQELDEPTLIYCKSPRSAYTLAQALLKADITSPSQSASAFADWLRSNYHPKWVLADLLDAGIAVHHGVLPRSVAHHLLRKFNEQEVKFLLCTSTIIEGVNTSAKNVIIFDKKIGNQKPFDLFTFNNIKGRAGRMLKHFVGHVFVLNSQLQLELPLVDFPAFTQPDDTPESLLIQIEQRDLSVQSREKLKYLHGQDILPIEVMRSNSGMSPEYQLNLATELTSNIEMYHSKLDWSRFPKMPQLYIACSLIFDYLMDGKARDGIGNANHLHMKIKTLVENKTLPALVAAELDYKQDKSPSDALETVLKFVRQWGEFHFPRYLTALDNIQRSVFEKAGRRPGDYSVFGSSVKRLFMPLAATVLEEYGLPFQVTLQIEKANPLGDEVDHILTNLQKTDVSSLGLDAIEVEMANDTINNL